MNVDGITEKLKLFGELPYKCIFFNGVWGIGKTYAADKAKESDRVVRASLTGIKTSSELYTEILDAFIGQDGITDVVKKFAGTALKVASRIEEAASTAGIVTDVAESLVSSKNVLRAFLAKRQTLRIVILDDFERVWDGIDITEVFRVVEFLTNQKNVKVAMIGDLSKLPDDIKKRFETYSERYIDKIYGITAISDSIDWEEASLEIDREFITEFRLMHGVSNLRSLIKANNFYKDIKNSLLSNSKIVKEDSERFWNDLRLTCFAIVIESIDQLKLKENDKITSNQEDEAFNALLSDLDYRIREYLSGSKFGQNMVKPLLTYYERDDLYIDVFDNLYQLSLKDDSPIYFYSDSETVKKDLPQMRKSFSETENLDELVRTAKDYMQLCEICGLNYEEGISQFKTQFHKVLIDILLNENEGFLESSYFSSIIDFSNMEKLLATEIEDAKRVLVNHWIDMLIENDFTEKELKIADKLFNYSYTENYKTYIAERYSDLLCEIAFPINAHDDVHYYTCIKIMKILYRIDERKLYCFYNHLMDSDIDVMAKHRCKNAMERCCHS